MSDRPPAGWKETALRDHLALTPGFAFKSDSFSKHAADGVPLIRIRDLTTQKPEVYVSEHFDACYLVKSGDFLVGMDGEFRAVRWKGADAALNQRVLKFSPSSSAIDPEFLFYRLQPELKRLESLISATTVKHLSTKHLSSLSICLPPLIEQRQIADILARVDEAIQATQAVLAQTRKVKQGVLERLLTKGIGHTEFVETELGDIPKEWRVVQIGDLANVRGGKRMPKGRPFSDTKTAHPYIRVSDLKNGTVATRNLVYVNPVDRAEIKRYTIACEDVYISIAGTIGLVGRVPQELDGAQLTENAAKIVIADKRAISAAYLSAVMASQIVQRQIEVAKGIGGGVPKLALFRIEQMWIPIPSMAEQDEMARIVAELTSSEEAQRSEYERFKKLKEALMSDLLTGRRRITADLSLAA